MAPHDIPATLANWRTHPVNRFSFRNVRDVIACVDIERGSGPPSDLPSDLAAFDGFCLDLPNAPSLDIEGFARTTATDGLAIVHRGNIVYEWYDHGNDARTPHIVMSASKSIVGLVAGILCGRSQLDVDALVTKYVPEVANGPYRSVSLRHLLDMRSGVLLSPAQTTSYDAATGWNPPGQGDEDMTLHSFFASLNGESATPGGPFKYLSANTDLLGWAIERATGDTFANLTSELLWQPMGAEDGAYITVDREGSPRCTGGVCATLRDFARVGQLIVDGGRRGAQDIVPADWLGDIEDNGDAEAWSTGEFAMGFAGMHMTYRDSWYVIDDAPKTTFAMGIHGQNLFVDRANEIVIAKFSSQASPLDFRSIWLTHRALPEIRRCLSAST